MPVHDVKKHLIEFLCLCIQVDAATEKKIKAVDNEVKVKEKDILG